MKTKRSIALTVIITLTVLLGTTTAWSVLAGIKPPPVFPGGVHTGVHPALVVETAAPIDPAIDTITETVIPVDPECNTMAFTCSCDTRDPTLGCAEGPLAEADHLTDFVGNMVRTDWNTWFYTGVAYGTKKVEGQPRPVLVYIAVVRGTATYTSDGNSKTSEGTLAVYGPEQDADSDGFPDAGETPLYDGPASATLVTRLSAF